MGSPTLFLFSSPGRRSYVAACLFSAGECLPTLPLVSGRRSYYAEGFALWGEFLSQRWERNQRIAGGDSHRRREQAPSGSSSFSPRPPENTGPNSRGLPNTVRRGRDNDCPRIRAAAAVGPKSRRLDWLDQTGAPDGSSSNLCGGKSAGGHMGPPLRRILPARQIVQGDTVKIGDPDQSRQLRLPFPAFIILIGSASNLHLLCSSRLR